MTSKILEIYNLIYEKEEISEIHCRTIYLIRKSRLIERVI